MEQQYIGIAIHVTMVLVFIALSLRTRPLVKLAHLTIAAANLAGMFRIIFPKYQSQIELYGLLALLIPFTIAMYLTVALLVATPKAQQEQQP
jgi:hypothetical protein